jgi:hypothetical protein
MYFCRKDIIQENGKILKTETSQMVIGVYSCNGRDVDTILFNTILLLSIGVLSAFSSTLEIFRFLVIENICPVNIKYIY